MLCAVFFFILPAAVPIVFTQPRPDGCDRRVGLKATLVLANQIWKLTSVHPHYAANQTVQDNVAALNAFEVTDVILESVSRQTT